MHCCSSLEEVNSFGAVTRSLCIIKGFCLLLQRSSYSEKALPNLVPQILPILIKESDLMLYRYTHLQTIPAWAKPQCLIFNNFKRLSI